MSQGLWDYGRGWSVYKRQGNRNISESLVQFVGSESRSSGSRGDDGGCCCCCCVYFYLMLLLAYLSRYGTNSSYCLKVYALPRQDLVVKMYSWFPWLKVSKVKAPRR